MAGGRLCRPGGQLRATARGEGRGLAGGNRRFPPASQNIVPTICEKRITVTVSSSDTSRL
jgi:hypothetical protein